MPLHPFAAQDEEAGQGCILLLGPCIHSPPWWAEKNFSGEKTSSGACGKELCIEGPTLPGWKINANANKKEEKRSETTGTVQKEEAC